MLDQISELFCRILSAFYVLPLTFCFLLKTLNTITCLRLVLVEVFQSYLIAILALDSLLIRLFK